MKSIGHRYTPPRQTWSVTLDGSREVVELLPYSGRLWGSPDSFRVGTTERKLELPPGLPWRQRAKAPIVGSVELSGHRLTLTRTGITLSIRTAIRRNVSGLKRTGALAFVGTILGGAGLGGGLAAGAQTTMGWLIYALDVDGKARGSWVGKAVDGVVERWTWVPPGGSLPDNTTLDF